MDRMGCEVSIRKSSALVVLRGAIFTREAEVLRAQFLELSRHCLQEVVIDLGEVTYIGGDGIGKVLMLYKSLAARGGILRLVQIPGPVYQLFLEMRLDTLFELTPGQ